MGRPPKIKAKIPTEAEIQKAVIDLIRLAVVTCREQHTGKAPRPDDGRFFANLIRDLAEHRRTVTLARTKGGEAKVTHEVLHLADLQPSMQLEVEQLRARLSALPGGYGTDEDLRTALVDAVARVFSEHQIPDARSQAEVSVELVSRRVSLRKVIGPEEERGKLTAKTLAAALVGRKGVSKWRGKALAALTAEVLEDKKVAASRAPEYRGRCVVVRPVIDEARSVDNARWVAHAAVMHFFLTALGISFEKAPWLTYLLVSAQMGAELRPVGKAVDLELAETMLTGHAAGPFVSSTDRRLESRAAAEAYFAKMMRSLTASEVHRLVAACLDETTGAQRISIILDPGGSKPVTRRRRGRST